MVAALAPFIFWDPRESAHWPGARHDRGEWNVRQLRTQKPPSIPTYRHEAHSQGYLPPNSLSVKSQLVQDTAKVTIWQQFINNTDHAISNASYTFPLPAGSTVVDFKCSIGGRRWLQGQIKPRAEAHNTFRSAIERNKSAALLDQHNPEVFSTSLGAIPHHAHVQVELSFVTLLKYRFLNGSGVTTFTLPTYIAPRYGAPPQTLRQTSPQDVELDKLDIEVHVLAANKIVDIKCATENVDVMIGVGGENCQTWREFVAPGGANLQDERKALVKLLAGNTHLERDFTLEIWTDPEDSLESPFACVETSPSLPPQVALMLTIPANFMLQRESQSSKRDIIFVADLSGSMSDKIDSLKSSMMFFLNGLPMDCYFNIVCFGTSFKSLWSMPKAYSKSALQEAISYVTSHFSADMGGTELFPALERVFNMTTQHHLSDIVVLTDGQIWTLKETLKLVQDEKSKSEGSMRLFALGVGDAVSHELVEGLAKAGGGYSEVIPAQQQEGWESKIVAVLQAALREHVGPMRVELDGVEICDVSLNHWLEDQNPAKDVEDDTQRNLRPPANDIFWSPRNPTCMSPFLRNRLFVLVDSPTQHSLSLSKFTIKVPRVGVEPATIEVPVKELARPDSTVFKLGARTILGDLECGQSHLHVSQNTPDSSTVQKEGARLGCKWSLVSQWTSFIAVEEEVSNNRTHQSNLVDQELENEMVDITGSILLRARKPLHTLARSDLQHAVLGETTEGGDNDKASSSEIQFPDMPLLYDSKDVHDVKDSQLSKKSTITGENELLAGSLESDSLVGAPEPPRSRTPSSSQNNSNAAYSNAPIIPDHDHRYSNSGRSMPLPRPLSNFSFDRDDLDRDDSGEGPACATIDIVSDYHHPVSSRPSSPLSSHRSHRVIYAPMAAYAPQYELPASATTLEQKIWADTKSESDFLRKLVTLQVFDGSFSLSANDTGLTSGTLVSRLSANDNVRALFGEDFVTRISLIKQNAQFEKTTTVAENETATVTAAVIAILDLHFQSCKSMWQRMYDKAKEYLSRHLSVGRQALEVMAYQVFRDFEVPKLHVNGQHQDLTTSKDLVPTDFIPPLSKFNQQHSENIPRQKQGAASKQQEDTSVHRLSLSEIGDL